ncbi:MAG: hypothetical protein QXQ39_01210 [Conexivisphaerales archaeon]
MRKSSIAEAANAILAVAVIAMSLSYGPVYQGLSLGASALIVDIVSVLNHQHAKGLLSLSSVLLLVFFFTASYLSFSFYSLIGSQFALILAISSLLLGIFSCFVALLALS